MISFDCFFYQFLAKNCEALNIQFEAYNLHLIHLYVQAHSNYIHDKKNFFLKIRLLMMTKVSALKVRKAHGKVLLVNQTAPGLIEAMKV